MKKNYLILCAIFLTIFIVFSVAYAGKCWRVTHENKESDKVFYVLKCDSGKTCRLHYWFSSGKYTIGYGILAGKYNSFDEAASICCGCD